MVLLVCIRDAPVNICLRGARSWFCHCVSKQDIDVTWKNSHPMTTSALPKTVSFVSHDRKICFGKFEFQGFCAVGGTI
jgi:hypothetical protein